MKTRSLLLLPILALSLAVFAETQPTECTSHPSFDANKCQVCYTETFDAAETATGWTSNITTVTIPWEHDGGELDEIIYDNEQKFPEIKTSLAFTTNPVKPEELWMNHESLVWTPFTDHKEVFIKKGEEVGLYTLAEKAGITVQGKKADDTIMLVTPLVVRDFDPKTNEDSDANTRNICVLGKFVAKKNIIVTDTAPAPKTDIPKTTEPETLSTADAIEQAPATPAVPAAATDTATPETTEVTPAFNAAEEEKTVITAEQTTTPTGPAFWILLLLAFAFASGWNAWKKQKG